MSVMTGVSDTGIAIRDKHKCKIGSTNVKRYWPGKAPEWADDADGFCDIRMVRPFALEKAFSNHEDLGIVEKIDFRLHRLAKSRIDNRDEIRADHKRIRLAEIVSTEEENRTNEGPTAEKEDEDAFEERRRRIKGKMLQRKQEETPLLEEKEEDDEELEYETDSEEEFTGIAIAKEVYVPKSERETIAERERLEAKEAIEEADKRKLEHRKIETRQIGGFRDSEEYGVEGECN
ncbi:hypothetical protein REPUB_Repub06bG0070000 [Reevesia pubescens]